MNVGKPKLLTSKPLSQPALQPRADLGASAAMAHYLTTARTRTEAQIAASRLPSFQLQTRTRTVAGRPQLRSQLRFAGSGSHSPPRWRNARAPMRSIAFPSFLHPGGRCVPALRKMRAISGLRPLRFVRPSGKEPDHDFAGISRHASSVKAHGQARSCGTF